MQSLRSEVLLMAIAILFASLISIFLGIFITIGMAALISLVAANKEFRDLIQLNKNLKKESNFKVCQEQSSIIPSDDPTPLESGGIMFRICDGEFELVRVMTFSYGLNKEAITYRKAYFNGIRSSSGSKADRFIHNAMFCVPILIWNMLEKRPKRVYNSYIDIVNL